MNRLALCMMVGLAGCGDDGGGSTPKDASTIDTPRPIDGGTIDSRIVPDAPANTAPLTVMNYLNWCEVSVDGGAASAASTQTVNVMPGTITLTASAATGFILGPDMWHHTNGDSGSGEPGAVSGGVSTAMVTVGTTAKCVWVCCPFPDGTGCEPNVIGEQCP